MVAACDVFLREASWTRIASHLAPESNGARHGDDPGADGHHVDISALGSGVGEAGVVSCPCACGLGYHARSDSRALTLLVDPPYVSDES